MAKITLQALDYDNNNLDFRSVDDQFKQAIIDQGLIPPEQIIIDGNLHRFRAHTDKIEKTGWYVAFDDDTPVLTFGDWRTGIEGINVVAKTNKIWSAQDQIQNAERIKEAKKLRDQAQRDRMLYAKNEIQQIWSDGLNANIDHPYLAKKKLRSAHCAKIGRDGRLMLPLYDQSGELCSIQYIDSLGNKLYHAGASVAGHFCILGTPAKENKLYVAEGFATAATICETTKIACVVAYGASNLVPVLGAIRSIFGTTQDVTIVADNDKSGVGQRYAEQASAKYGAHVVVIPEYGDANDYLLAGNDLLGLLEQKKTDTWYAHALTFCSQPTSVGWLIKNWIQEKALIMMHGASGSGKTFIVLDMCMHIATNKKLWAEKKVKNGDVIYLAGEGYHGLKCRVAAWISKHKPDDVNLWLSKSGCDLNTTEGLYKVITETRLLQKKPILIVVDTLHRFLDGSENDPADVKAMADACEVLIREFGCTVIIIHHTGLSEEAKDRARGSSSWKGVLDIEISIQQKKDGNIDIIQKKSKDAELAQAKTVKLCKTRVFDWLDEDNEPVYSATVDTEAVIDAKQTGINNNNSSIALRKKQWQDIWVKSGMEFVNKS